jgi:hypothetical protein
MKSEKDQLLGLCTFISLPTYIGLPLYHVKLRNYIFIYILSLCM